LRLCRFLGGFALGFFCLSHLFAPAAVAFVLAGDDGINPRSDDSDRRGDDIDDRPDAPAD